MVKSTDRNDQVQFMASALFARRFGAILIDMAMCFGFLYLIEQGVGDAGMFASERSDLTKNILFSVYMFASHAMFRGRSLGKKLLGLRVMRSDAQRAGAFELLYREFLGRFLIEKSNLLLCYVLNATGALENLRALTSNPLMDTMIVAVVSLPWLTFVSFAFALCRPDGRTLHDLVSGTMIIRD